MMPIWWKRIALDVLITTAVLFSLVFICVGVWTFTKMLQVCRTAPQACSGVMIVPQGSPPQGPAK